MPPNNAPFTGCTESKTFPFVIVGGTAPYSVSSTSSSVAPNVINPQTVRSPGDVFTVQPYKGLLAPYVGSTTVVVIDSSLPQKTVSAIINCKA